MAVLAIAPGASHALASESNAALILGLTSPLLLVSTSLFISQLHLRLRSIYRGYYRLGWDDSFLILAAVFSVAAFAFLVAAIAHALDSKKSLSQHARNQIDLWLSVSRPCWIWSSVWAKISLGSTIMRVKVSPLSRALTTSFLVFVPMATFALWLPTIINRTASSSVHLQQVDYGLYLGIALVFLIADAILTMPPLLFLFSMRPLAELIIASFLCLLGALAVGCSIGRVILTAQNYQHVATGNLQEQYATSTIVPYIILAAVEASVSIIAACTPTIFHVSAKLVHLIPAAYRDQLIRKKSTSTSRRDNTTPDIDSAQRQPPDATDRWSRDLGLDALPDNPRFSTLPPRMRQSWLSWRHSAAFGLPSRINHASAAESALRRGSQDDRMSAAVRSPTAMSFQVSERQREHSRQASGLSPASRNRDSARFSRSFARRSFWTQRSHPSDIAISDRRHSSSGFAAWLQWDQHGSSLSLASASNVALDGRREDQLRAHGVQAQPSHSNWPSEKLYANGSQPSASPIVSTDHPAKHAPTLSEDDGGSKKADEDTSEPTMSYNSPTSESFDQQEKVMTDAKHEVGDARPLSWESAQHQYFEPQLSAGLDIPAELLWPSVDNVAAGSEPHGLAQESEGAWFSSNQRLDSTASADDAGAADPPVLTIRNL